MSHFIPRIWPERFLHGMTPEVKKLVECTPEDDPEKFFNRPEAVPLIRRMERELEPALARDCLLQLWVCARWVAAGRRTYVSDLATARALRDTRIGNLPFEVFHLPVPAFYLQIPREFEWLSTHRQTQKKDVIEGLLVTEVTHSRTGIHGLCVVETTARDLVTVLMRGYPTTGYLQDLLTTKGIELCFLRDDGTVESSPANPGALQTIDQILQYIISTCLYLTSVSPQLVALPPPPRPTAPRKGRHKREWNEYERQTQSRVTLVGGPQLGHKIQRTDQVGQTYPERRPPRPHIRAGHYKHVWRGHRGGVDRRAEIRWIQPTVVGDIATIVAWQRIHQQRVRPTLKKENPIAVEVLGESST